MHKRKYEAFGLSIFSELELPELIEADFDIPDITINLGDTPNTIENDLLPHRPLLSINKTQYLQKLPVATFFVEDGKKITVSPNNDSDEDSVRLFMFSNAFAAILHQRSFLCLHTSAFNFNAKAILITGESGSGKSTTLMALLQKGHDFFSDDVCVLTKNSETDNYNMVLPSYPGVKLWEDSFEKLQLNLLNETIQLRPELPKYRINTAKNKSASPLPVSAIFILQKDGRINQPVVKQLTAFSAIEKMNILLYRFTQSTTMQTKTELFKKLTDLIKSTKIYELRRPVDGNSISQVVELIERELNNLDAL